MTETKITQLSAVTTPYITDVLPIVTDPTGTPATNKVQGLHLLNPWLRFSETCAYASATSFTIPGNYSTYFTIGTKVRLYNSSTKYGYVLSSSYSSPNTTVNLVANSTYSLANAAVTNVCISYASPYDFPSYLSFAMEWTSNGTQPSIGDGTVNSYFKITDRTLGMYFMVVFGAGTTFGTGIYKFNIPVNMAVSGQSLGVWRGNDAGSTNYSGVLAYDSSMKISMVVDGGSYVTNTAPFTWGSGDSIRGTIQYPI